MIISFKKNIQILGREKIVILISSTILNLKNNAYLKKKKKSFEHTERAYRKFSNLTL